MVAEAEEVLATWRSAERLLTTLANDAPERNALLVGVIHLRSIYARIRQERIDPTAELIHETRERIVTTRRLIDAAEARLRIEGRRELSR